MVNLASYATHANAYMSRYGRVSISRSSLKTSGPNQRKAPGRKNELVGPNADRVSTARVNPKSAKQALPDGVIRMLSCKKMDQDEKIYRKFVRTPLISAWTIGGLCI
jgi:hypothetical protein